MTERLLSLEDVRRDPSLLDQFIKQHESKGNKDRFEAVLNLAATDTVTPAKGGGDDGKAANLNRRTRQAGTGRK